MNVSDIVEAVKDGESSTVLSEQDNVPLGNQQVGSGSVIDNV